MDISTSQVLTFTKDDKLPVTINFDLAGKKVSLICYPDGTLVGLAPDDIIKTHLNSLRADPNKYSFSGKNYTNGNYGAYAFDYPIRHPDGTIIWPSGRPDGYGPFYYRRCSP